MSDHALIAIIGIVGFAFQFAGLVMLGLMARDARREAHRDATVVAGLMVQEIQKLRGRL
jgi:hypothetical protein